MPPSFLVNKHGQTTLDMSCHHRLGYITHSNDVQCGMLAWSLGSTHDLTTSSVACHYRPWTSHMIRPCQVWHAIITLRQHTRSDEVRRGMLSRFLTTHMVGLLGAWHAIIAFEHPKRMNNVESCMQSLPLCNTQGRMTSVKACHNRPWIAHTIGRRQAWNVIFSFR